MFRSRRIRWADTATLVLLDTTGSAYDRETYPQAAFVALISSDCPRLTTCLLRSVPARGNVAFKPASDGDRAVVAERFPISRATSFRSFTVNERATFAADSQVSVSRSASDEVLRLLAGLGHSREWLLPLRLGDSPRINDPAADDAHSPLRRAAAVDEYWPHSFRKPYK